MKIAFCGSQLQRVIFEPEQQRSALWSSSSQQWRGIGEGWWGGGLVVGFGNPAVGLNVDKTLGDCNNLNLFPIITKPGIYCIYLLR